MFIFINLHAVGTSGTDPTALATTVPPTGSGKEKTQRDFPSNL